MKKFISSVMAASLLMGAGATQAKTILEEIALPDGSKHVTVVSKNGGFIAPSATTMTNYHCNPTCAVTNADATSNSGVVGMVADPVGFVAGMRALRPPKGDTTLVSNDSSSKSQGGEAVAVVDQSYEYEEDNSSYIEFYRNEGPIGIFPPPPPPPPPAPDIKG